MLNLIIENLINKNEKNLDFNFSKSIKENIQKDYDNKLPIEINESESGWDNITDHHGEKLVKTYSFQNYQHMLYFINEYIKKIKTLHKNAAMIVDKMNVQITLFTEEIMQITELDLDLAKYLDEINSDITFIRDL